MAYAPQHVWLVDKRDGRKFLGPAHYADIFDYITVAPSQRAADTTRQVTEPAKTTAATTATEPARTTTSKTKAEEATR